MEWSNNGHSFVISDKEAFVEMLPHFFKTKNFNSFVRQLNMYGFHKVKGSNDQEFKHPFFRKGHGEYLGYIKRRYAHGKNNIKSDVKDSDISPSRYFDLRQQLNFVSEKVDSSSKEVDRLSEENAKLQQLCKRLHADNQNSAQKSLILVFSLLSQGSDMLSTSLQAHLANLNINIDEILPVLHSVGVEHVIEQNLFNKIFRTENCRSIIDGFATVLSNHINQKRMNDDLEKIKRMLLMHAYGDLNQQLVVPTISRKVSLNVNDEVVDTSAHSTGRKSVCFDEYFEHN